VAVIVTPLGFGSPEGVALVIGELVGEVRNNVKQQFFERGERVEAWECEKGAEEGE
jgi:hypothetical protein